MHGVSRAGKWIYTTSSAVPMQCCRFVLCGHVISIYVDNNTNKAGMGIVLQS